jgi:phenylalanyl-tRNA synthetase beta chain
MSLDQSRLRTTLLGSLLDAAHYNRSHGVGDVRLFEAGPVYLPAAGEPLPREPQHIGALLIGAIRPPTWRDPAPREADLFAVKGVLGGLLERLRVSWEVDRGVEPFLHPGRAATVSVGGDAVGWLGEIHPLVAARWDLTDTVAAFELDVDAVVGHSGATPLYADVTSYPAVREDLAVVVSAATTAAEVLTVVSRVGGSLLADAEVFDVYRGAQAGEGNVSLALRLVFRAPDRTLRVQEVAERRAAIAAALSDELGGRVRDA